MTMNRFQFVNANSVTQAIREINEGAVFKAGGVDLLDRMKEGVTTPKKLVNVRDIKGLEGIQEDASGGVRIGPLATLAQIAESPLVRRRYAALAEAANAAATPQIRNMATAGGNLVQRPRCWYFRQNDFPCLRKGGHKCYAIDGENQYHAIFENQICAIVHPSALAVPLVAYGAKLEFAGKEGKRTAPLEQFFVVPSQNPFAENDLHPGELITSIMLPPPVAGTVSAYTKQKEKESFDWPIAGVAVVLRMAGDRCASASMVLEAAAPIPWRAKSAEAVLKGAAINETTARAAAKEAMAGATPLSLNAYKLPVFEAVIRRTILRAAKA